MKSYLCLIDAVTEEIREEARDNPVALLLRTILRIGASLGSRGDSDEEANHHRLETPPEPSSLNVTSLR